MPDSDDPPSVPEEYRNFRFRLKYLSRYVAGFDEVSPLPQKLRTADRHASGYPPLAIGPEGQATPFFINLDRGITCDLGFEQWISMVRCYGPATDKGSLLVEYKRPFTVEVCNATGETEYVYHLSHCWVDEYKAVTGLEECPNEIAIEHLRLGFDAWKREPEQ
ncbi:MAG: hypothetical protein GYA23_05615 [Methanomicrobiales archaeon]|nr:hypothetical protein [Methanomicrobiales archaeon]